MYVFDCFSPKMAQIWHKKLIPNNSHPSQFAKCSVTDYITNMENGKIHNDKQKPDRRIQFYQRQLRRLASELSLVEARERREIASDLHEHIGQALAFVSQKVNILKGNSVFSGMESNFSEILNILEKTIRYTRNLTVEISPPILYELGLPATIEWLAERAYERYKLKVLYYETGTAPDMADDIKVFIFKSVQELLNNIVKHAKAKKAKIYANWGKNELEIIISDKGCGFNTTNFETGEFENCCFGLFSIRERLSYIGGSLNIESVPDIGTKISIISPYRITSEAKGD